MKLENYTKKTKKYSEKCQRGPNNKNDNKLQQKQKSANWRSIKLHKQQTKNTKK